MPPDKRAHPVHALLPVGVSLLGVFVSPLQLVLGQLGIIGVGDIPLGLLGGLDLHLLQLRLLGGHRPVQFSSVKGGQHIPGLYLLPHLYRYPGDQQTAGNGEGFAIGIRNGPVQLQAAFHRTGGGRLQRDHRHGGARSAPGDKRNKQQRSEKLAEVSKTPQLAGITLPDPVRKVQRQPHGVSASISSTRILSAAKPVSVAWP